MSEIIYEEGFDKLNIASLASRFALVVDSSIEKIWGHKLLSSLRDLDVEIFPIIAKEELKTRASKEALEDRLLAKGFSTDTAIIAMGGGVTTDLAGFVAATYCRAVPLVTIPTTLLGMVDASIGGKNGVNVPQGKNLIGTNYLPKLIYCNFETLCTLPEKERVNGLVEMLKHGLVRDADHFYKLLSLNVTPSLIKESASIKIATVREGPTVRNILNFGHTVGHALEKNSNYRLSHGEAVALGMIVESYLSTKLSSLSATSFEKIVSAIGSLKIQSADFDDESLIEIMQYDKKSKGGNIRCVLLQEIGKADPCDGQWCKEVPISLMKEALKRC